MKLHFFSYCFVGLLLLPTLLAESLLPNFESFSSANMSFVTVGNPNNDPDPLTRLGGIDEIYQIGKYDVTADQYCEFLNAVAADDPYNLYSVEMGLDTNIACIQRYGEPGNYSYFVINDGRNRGNFPITYVSWYSAARFCNWMQNGCPTGVEGPWTTENGTYSLENHQAGKSIKLNDGATYFLPTENQWYKAAFYVHTSPDFNLYWYYPTQSDYFAPSNKLADLPNSANYQAGILLPHFAELTPPRLTPVGTFHNSPGPYGTYDMGGDAFQWTATRITPGDASSFFIARGGSWKSHYQDLRSTTRRSFDPNTASSTIGFRLVKQQPAL